MKNLKRKTIANVVALFLLFAMVISLALPVTNAQTETASMATFAFIGATPNPVGVGQEVLLHVGISTPLANVALGWEGLSVTITRPDGKTETLSDIRTDATGGTGTIYVPTMTGNYTLQTHFLEQTNPAYNSRFGLPEGAIMLASDSEKLTLVVRDEPLPIYPETPLPTEYWTRPIDAQNWEWAAISGNWLKPRSLFGLEYAPYNNAPETAHILWTKPYTTGGLAGGELGVQSYENGAAYEHKFRDSVIIAGVLYYNRFAMTSAAGLASQGVVAVDLHTGEELWFRNNTRVAFGQVFYWDSYNYHGVFAYLWETVGSTWNAYDPATGEWVYTMTDVPSGTNLWGSKGEIYRYNVDTTHGWMTLWNSSRAGSSEGSWGRSIAHRTIDASRGIEWNITIPEGLSGSAQEVLIGDRVFGGAVSTTEVNSWAFSLKPGQEGQLLLKNTWKAPAEWAAGNVSLRLNSVSLEDGVFIVTVKETRQHWGFSTETGEKLWGPTESQNYLDMYQDCNGQIVDGKFISGTMSGILYCYDPTTGELLWTHATKDPYNTITWSNNFPRRNPASFVSDGKVYTGSYEHSPINPLARGTPFECINETTGELIWSIPMYTGSYYMTSIIGDSIIATFNSFDNRIYAIGKGPSATTVTASPEVSVYGSSVLVKGMVTDLSPGTEEYALTARFPNGVPAVSDECISSWMEYLYMQKPRPTNATGVEVVVSVLDPNSNSYEVGRTTSDSSGMFSCAFTPEVPGKYTVIATFAGSEGYWPSQAETALNVEEAPASTPEPTPIPASAADLYFLPVSAGMIVAIVVVLALLMLILRKR